MRIVGGKFAGRHLTSPNDFRVRPTAEPVRVALMKLLRADLQEARILDLFAGTGAVGLEALSRGGKYVDFVEFRPSSLHALKANIAALRVREKARIYKKDALLFAEALSADRYDLAFADPPYESRQLDRVIEAWLTQPFSTVLAVEHAASHVIPPGAIRHIIDEGALTIYRKQSASNPPAIRK